MKILLEILTLLTLSSLHSRSYKCSEKDLIGDWCTSYRNCQLILTRQPTITQCSGIEFSSGGIAKEYLAPNIFAPTWKKRNISYELTDSILTFQISEKDKKTYSEIYKVASVAFKEIILEKL